MLHGVRMAGVGSAARAGLFGAVALLIVVLLGMPLNYLQAGEKEKDEPKDIFSTKYRLMDKFGNPQGGDLGLSKDGEFKGKKLLVWGHLKGEQGQVFFENHAMWKALRKRGFEVTLMDKQFPRDMLPRIDQLWIISYDVQTLKDDDITALEKFVDAGKGLYLLADNEPYFAQAREIAKRWYGTDMRGSYTGTKVGYLKERNLAKEVIEKFNGQYAIEGDHPLFMGVNFVYEGITLSHFDETPKLKVVMRASDGKALVGVDTQKGRRVILDCGFTRYFCDPSNPDTAGFINITAGTLRYGENVAAFLMGKEKRY